MFGETSTKSVSKCSTFCNSGGPRWLLCCWYGNEETYTHGKKMAFDTNVVYVRHNYRLHVFCFMALQLVADVPRYQRASIRVNCDNYLVLITAKTLASPVQRYIITNRPLQPWDDGSGSIYQFHTHMMCTFYAKKQQCISNLTGSDIKSEYNMRNELISFVCRGHPETTGVLDKVSRCYIIIVLIPACTCRKNDVIFMSMQRDHVVSTSIRCHFGTICPQGISQNVITVKEYHTLVCK